VKEEEIKESERLIQDDSSNDVIVSQIADSNKRELSFC
jgi:hypothetical protein